MGKVILFAVLTMDGCLTDCSAEAKQWLADTDMADRFEITEMKKAAHILDENTSLTLLSDWMKDSPFHSVCFIEANASTASIINGMMRYRQVDEIILCTIPVIAGNGYRLFLSDLPASKWSCKVKIYKDGSMKAIYRKCNADIRQKSTNLMGRLFRK